MRAMFHRYRAVSAARKVSTRRLGCNASLRRGVLRPGEVGPGECEEDGLVEVCSAIRVSLRVEWSCR